MNHAPFDILGKPRKGGFLIIGDHASNDVPEDIVLGIDPARLDAHIAWDIGVAPVAHLITQNSNFAAHLGRYSRLVVDLNRDETDPAVMPVISDAIVIPGNDIAPDAREARLRRFYRPYHAYLKDLLSDHRPALILSLHSFTPALESKPNEARPWEVGVLYNEQEAASKLAIPFLEDAGYLVGDQLPYSGKFLNATMNRHAEANDIPYIGIEMRQDLASTPSGQARFARILSDMCHFVSERLG
ncbi:MAG: N-formylglutamate amidohydrolase [Sphingomonadales bacterium 28-55-16]|nr:MAG: N-formylglutamate amidohydrolase [Sphingomonadales bacterium 28-55-16]